MKTKMLFICMMVFYGTLSDLPLWGQNKYALGGATLPSGARAGLSIAPLSAPNFVFPQPSRFRYVSGPQDLTWDFAYSPDGRFLVIGGTGFTEGLRLFNAKNLQLIHEGAHYTLIHNLTFSPDGKTLTGGTLGGRVLFLDTPSLHISYAENPGFVLSGGPVPIAWLSPDRSTLAMERGDIYTSVLRWSDLRGNTTRTVRRQKETNGGFPIVLSVGFDPTASTLATANQEGIIHLWGTGSGKHLQKFSQYVTVFDEDYCDIGVYEVNVGEDFGGREYWRSDDSDDSGPPSPDRHVVIATHDHLYELGSRETREDLTKIIHVYEKTYKFKAGHNTQCVSDWVEVIQPLKRLIGHQDTIWNVVYGTEGEEIASAGYDDTIRVWDVEGGYELTTFTSQTLRFSNIAFGRDGKALAVGNIDGTIEVRMGNQWWHPFQAHAGPVTSVAFHPQWESYTVELESGESAEVPVAPTLASAGTDGTVRFWHLHLGSQRVSPRTAPWVFYSKPLGSDEDFTRVSTQFDPLIDVGDIVTSVAFSPDSHTFAFGSWKGAKVLKLWRPGQGEKPIFHYDDPDFTPFDPWKPVLSVAYSPAGDTLAAGCLDGTINLQDISSISGTMPLGILKGHKASVFKVVFSADGRTLASGSDDGTVLLWNRSPDRPSLVLNLEPDQSSDPDESDTDTDRTDTGTDRTDTDESDTDTDETDTDRSAETPSTPDSEAEVNNERERVPGPDPVTFNEIIQPEVLVTAATPPVIYWIDDGMLYRFAEDKGTKIADSVNGIAVGSDKFYWTSTTGAAAGSINTANLDGSDPTTLKTIMAVPIGIAVDTANSKLYWTNSRGRIQSATLNASGIKNVMQNLSDLTDIVVSNGFIYWTEGGNSIRRVNISGQKNTQDVAVNLGTVGGLAISGGRIYWTEQTGASAGTINAANLDGTQLKTLATLRAVPMGIAVDTVGRKLYWTNSRGRVQRANLDGTAIKNVVEGLTAPGLLAIRRTQTATIAAAPTHPGMQLMVLERDRRQEQIDLLIATARPEKTRLLANYPNPFNPETWIPYELATDTDVRITISNAQGVVIRTLQLGQQSAGYYTDRKRAAYWNGRNALDEQVASGIYFYQFETNEMSTVRKMVILK